MRKLAEEGMTMLVVTHEMGFARNVSSKTVFMENGVVVEQALPTNSLPTPARSGPGSSCGRSSIQHKEQTTGSFPRKCFGPFHRPPYCLRQQVPPQRNICLGNSPPSF